MWARPADLLWRERRLREALPELGRFCFQGLHIARPFALAEWELLAGSDSSVIAVHEPRRVDVRVDAHDGRLRQPESGHGDEGEGGEDGRGECDTARDRRKEGRRIGRHAKCIGGDRNARGLATPARKRRINQRRCTK